MASSRQLTKLDDLNQTLQMCVTQATLADGQSSWILVIWATAHDHFSAQGQASGGWSHLIKLGASMGFRLQQSSKELSSRRTLFNLRKGQAPCISDSQTRLIQGHGSTTFSRSSYPEACRRTDELPWTQWHSLSYGHTVYLR